MASIPASIRESPKLTSFDQPTYLSEIKDLRQHENAAGQQRSRRGHWNPSSLPEDHVASEALCFRHDRGTTRVLQSRPSNVHHYKSYSIYYIRGKFLAVPYDASLKQEDSSDDEGDGTAFETWQPLTFRHLNLGGCVRGLASYVDIRLQESRMQTQPADRVWMEYFLPDRYNPQPQEARRRGLVGKLALIIDLAATSQVPEQWKPALTIHHHRFN
ncbi:Hypothetical predicted protein [Lecanosticta acicola]|uniref:Uncharacterized protein n=1 Tax=Lecanosticta acicola TaxID=111012 RepID=A0AAI9E7Z7_9PEZI|nr:Hypothetical predicted protein [Lecanosticta acicola]